MNLYDPTGSGSVWNCMLTVSQWTPRLLSASSAWEKPEQYSTQRSQRPSQRPERGIQIVTYPLRPDGSCLSLPLICFSSLCPLCLPLVDFVLKAFFHHKEHKEIQLRDYPITGSASFWNCIQLKQFLSELRVCSRCPQRGKNLNNIPRRGRRGPQRGIRFRTEALPDHHDPWLFVWSVKQYLTQYTKLKNGKLLLDVLMIFEKTE